jgi:outer membrane lipoprotein-sorting protein
MPAVAPGGGSPGSSGRKSSLTRRFLCRAAPAIVAVLLCFEARPAERAASLSAAEIRAVLSLIRQDYSASPSVTADFAETYAPAGFPPASPETGRVVLQAPDRIRFDYDGSEGKVFTFDGTAARQYVAADRQMIVRTLERADRERLPLLFFESADSVLERYNATATRGGGGLVELTLTPKRGGEPARIDLTVRPAGDVESLAVTDAAGNRTAFTFSGKKAGGRRPDSEFALRPPAGTQVISE